MKIFNFLKEIALIFLPFPHFFIAIYKGKERENIINITEKYNLCKELELLNSVLNHMLVSISATTDI